jgi:heme/copper-type cytochrome/quinol oxidase subunit 2
MDNGRTNNINIANLAYKIYILFINSFSGIVGRVTKKWSESSKLEFTWTLVPALVLIALAIPSINYLYKFDTFVPFESTIVTAKIIGAQWLWFYDFSNLTEVQINEYESLLLSTLFFKGEDAKLRLLETTQPLYLPTFTPIRLLITSRDVLHCFAVPSLGIKMDACPGRLNQVFTLINR